MTIGFVVYIDESGDEGFLFDKGSSDWFVLSAAVTHKATDLKTVKLIDNVRKTLNRKDKEPLHFRKLKHEHRLPFLQQIALANLKIISVLVHKPSIQNVELFQQKNRLYFYAARLLLERVSWYCRDHTPKANQASSAQIIFSNRGGIKYADFREYMATLKKQTAPFEVEVDWNIIKPNQIKAYSDNRMGLQIADAAASSLFFSVQLNHYGFVEDRYARLLKPVIYLNKRRYNGYGLKFFPREYEAKLEQEEHLKWLQDFGF